MDRVPEHKGPAYHNMRTVEGATPPPSTHITPKNPPGEVRTPLIPHPAQDPAPQPNISKPTPPSPTQIPPTLTPKLTDINILSESETGTPKLAYLAELKTDITEECGRIKMEEKNK